MKVAFVVSTIQNKGTMIKLKKKTTIILILLIALLLLQNLFLKMGDRELFGPGNWQKALVYYHQAAVLGNSDAKLKELILVKYFIRGYSPPHYSGEVENSPYRGIVRYYPAPHFFEDSKGFKLVLFTSSYFPIYLLENASNSEKSPFEEKLHKLIFSHLKRSKDPLKRHVLLEFEINNAANYDDSLLVIHEFADDLPNSALAQWYASTITPSQEKKIVLLEKAKELGASKALIDRKAHYIENFQDTTVINKLLESYKEMVFKEDDFYAATILSKYYNFDSTPSEKNPSISKSEFWSQELTRVWKPINYRYWYMLGNIRQFLAIVEQHPIGYQFSKLIREKTKYVTYGQFLFWFVFIILIMNELFISSRRRVQRLFKWLSESTPNSCYTRVPRSERALAPRGKRGISIRKRR